MLLLGRNIADGKKVSTALTGFYGISHQLAHRLCARLSLHDTLRIGDLSEAQVAQISAFISSPATIPARSPLPLRSPLDSEAYQKYSSEAAETAAAARSAGGSSVFRPSQSADATKDPLRSLVLESDLRRLLRSNIGHHKTIGSYRGRRHQNNLPVRGQSTQRNAKTARKLNKLDRKGFATLAGREGVEHAATPTSRQIRGPGLYTAASSGRPSAVALLRSMNRRPSALM